MIKLIKAIFAQKIKQLKHKLCPKIENLEQLQLILKSCHHQMLVNHETYNLLENVLHLAELQVRDIMMPKSQMVFIPEHAEYANIIEIITSSGHSRFPVIAEHSDEILGILHAKDLLNLTEPEKEHLDLENLVRSTHFVPEGKPLNALLSDFRQNRNHLAMVVNEYGQTIGFVTLEDAIEQILGDISDEFDVEAEDPIKEIDAHHYILVAETPLETLNERLKTNFDDSQFDTIGGLLTAQFGYTPKRGQKLNFHGFQFKIINASTRRIKRIECFDKRQLQPFTEQNE